MGLCVSVLLTCFLAFQRCQNGPERKQHAQVLHVGADSAHFVKGSSDVSSADSKIVGNTVLTNEKVLPKMQRSVKLREDSHTVCLSMHELVNPMDVKAYGCT